MNFMLLVEKNIFLIGITLIEWGELIEPIIYSDYLKISFSKDNTNDNRRILTFEAHGKKYETIIKEVL